MARHNEVGKVGEDVAAEYLATKGYVVVERNFRRPYGEIDIVTRENGVLVFVEVKTVSWETPKGPLRGGTRPEENMHPMKIRRLGRVVQAYLLKHKYEGDWRLDLLTVRLNFSTRRARVEQMKNIVIPA